MNVKKFRETVCVRLFLYEIVGYQIVPFIVESMNVHKIVWKQATFIFEVFC